MPLLGTQDLQAPERHRVQLEAGVDQADQVRGHLVAPLIQILAGPGREIDPPDVEPGVAELAGPAELDLLHRRAEIAQHGAGVPGLLGDVGLDGVVAEVRAERDPQSLDAFRDVAEIVDAAGVGHDIALVGAVGDFEEQRRIADRARQRPEMGDVVEDARDDVHRDAPEAGFQSHQPAVGGRDADRAAHVGALGDRDTARADRGGRAARGAAGRARQVPGIAGEAPERAFGKAGVGELRRRGLADDDGAGGAQPRDDDRVLVGHPVLQDPRALGGALALHRREVLDRDRHAVERPVRRAARQAPVGRAGEGERLLAVDEAEAVERLVDLVDARQGVAHRLDRGKLAVADHARKLGGARVSQVEIAHPPWFSVP